MPYHRRYRRRRRRCVRGLATVPRMMPSSLARQRWNNASSKTFFIKDSGTLITDLTGSIQRKWSVQDVYSVPQFNTLGQLYDQFKVLAITIRLYPANVGIEPDPSLLPVGSNGLLRGNAGVWCDQRPATVGFPGTIVQMINYGSAKLINPRRPYKRTMFRATGFNSWGGIQTAAINDSWRGEIKLLQVDATPAVVGSPPPTLWYWSRTFKIIYRGRRST